MFNMTSKPVQGNSARFSVYLEFHAHLFECWDTNNILSNNNTQNSLVTSLFKKSTKPSKRNQSRMICGPEICDFFVLVVGVSTDTISRKIF